MPKKTLGQLRHDLYISTSKNAKLFLNSLAGKGNGSVRKTSC